MDEGGLPRMRIVVVGGAGNFGARIVRALRGDPNIELMVAGRRIVSVGYARSGGQRRPSGDLGSEYVTALSSAVVEELREGMSSLESIEVTIAPGQRAPRGRATLEAVFSYLGRTFLAGYPLSLPA